MCAYYLGDIIGTYRFHMNQVFSVSFSLGSLDKLLTLNLHQSIICTYIDNLCWVACVSDMILTEISVIMWYISVICLVQGKVYGARDRQLFPCHYWSVKCEQLWPCAMWYLLHRNKHVLSCAKPLSHNDHQQHAACDQDYLCIKNYRISLNLDSNPMVHRFIDYQGKIEARYIYVSIHYKIPFHTAWLCHSNQSVFISENLLIYGPWRHLIRIDRIHGSKSLATTLIYRLIGKSLSSVI